MAFSPAGFIAFCGVDAFLIRMVDVKNNTGSWRFTVLLIDGTAYFHLRSIVAVVR